MYLSNQRKNDGSCRFGKKVQQLSDKKIIPGKNNTAKIDAVCMGIPAVINAKNYRDGR